MDYQNKDSRILSAICTWTNRPDIGILVQRVYKALKRYKGDTIQERLLIFYRHSC